MVTEFDSYSYDGVSAGIWVIHTEVSNLGVVSDTFWRLLLWWCECLWGGLYSRGNGFLLLLLLLGTVTGIWVIHRVPNLGARWWRFLTVTLMMVWVQVYGSYLYRGGKSGCKMVTLFDSYSYDGVSAGIWVIHTYIHTCLLVQVWINSSPSLPNHCLWYGKLWGPSQRVVTLFYDCHIHYSSLTWS